MRTNLGLIYNNGGFGNYELYDIPLIKQVLHGGLNPIQPKVYRNMLNDAPCTGPFVYDYYNRSTWAKSPMGVPSSEWSSCDRIIHPERRDGGKYDDGKLDNAGFLGEFNGIDYMFYHNLYYTVKSKENKSPFNMIKNKITTPLPIIFGTYFGSTSTPVTITLFKSLEATNTIGGVVDPVTSTIIHGDITYKAGQEIILKPGFTVKPGSLFKTIIERIECSSGSGGVIYSVTGDSVVKKDYSFFDYFRPHNIPQEKEYNNFNYNQQEENILAEIEREEQEKFQKGLKFQLYPNPSKDYIKITVPAAFMEKEIKIAVYSTLGNLIKQFTLKETKTIDLSNYPKGVLLFKIQVEGFEMLELDEKVVHI